MAMCTTTILVLALFPLATIAVSPLTPTMRNLPAAFLDPVADPMCARGTPQGLGNPGQACCAADCTTCGGAACNQQPPGPACCTSPVAASGRLCNVVGPPCLIQSPNPSATPSPGAEVPRWITTTTRYTGRPRKRHEACFVWVRGKGYLLGGRGDNGLDILDPVAATWTQGAPPPVQMHHMQCVPYKRSIYVVSSWFGGFPFEQNNPLMWIYNTKKDRWRSRKGLPEPRRRGGGAAVLHDKKIYVVAGNRGGHGAHADTLGWMDYYDLVEKKWVTNLPDLPEGRDHVGGAMVSEKLCIAGGRNGGQNGFFGAVIRSTFCYDFSADKWEDMDAPIPAGRAGAATETTCDGKMMVVGGEGASSAAFSQVDVFDGTKWETIAPLNRARHGTGLGITKCSRCGQIFIASGSGARGGGPELDSTEVYLPDGKDIVCTKY